MPSINEILSIGRSGLGASRTRLAIASFNIANANTPGYSRQVADLVPSATPGTGVDALGPRAIRNQFVARSLATTLGNRGFYQGRATTLALVQETVNDLDGVGLVTSLDNFQNALRELSANPAGSAERQQVLGTAEQMIAQFKAVRHGFQEAMEVGEGQAQNVANQITLRARQVAKLNGQIQHMAQSGESIEALIDTRDQVVLELSELIEIDVIPQNDNSVLIYAGGGRPLVTDTDSLVVKVSPLGPAPYDDVGLDFDGDGDPDSNNDGIPFNEPGDVAVGAAPATAGYQLTVTFERVNEDGVTTSALAPIPGHDLGGELGGLLDAQNVTLSDKIDTVDEMAYRLVIEFNKLHTAGTDINGQTQNLFFKPIPDANLAIDTDGDGIADQPAPGADLLNPWARAAESLELVDGLTFDKIAAAQDDPQNPALDPATELAGDNTKVLEMADLITSTIVMNGTTLQATFDKIVQDIAQETQAADIGVFTEDASATQLSNLLVAETAVSIDEEMIEMTLANQAFEAAGMIIRNVDEMAETLLRLVG